MKITDMDKVKANRQVRELMKDEFGRTCKERALATAAVDNRDRPGIIRRIFGWVPSKLVDARLHKSIYQGDVTYRIELLYEKQGVHGKRYKSGFHMACFPGGDEYAWYSNFDEEAVEKLFEICDMHGITSQGSVFYMLRLEAMI